MGLDKCLVIFDQWEISMARFNPFNNSDMGIIIDRACCKGVRISFRVKGHQIIPILKYFRPQISHKRVDNPKSWPFDLSDAFWCSLIHI